MCVVVDTNRREYLKRRSAQHALLPELNNLTFFRGSGCVRYALIPFLF